VESLKLIMVKMRRLRAVLRKRASEHRYTIGIGRTHNIHGEPITFGFKLLGWLDVIERHMGRLAVLQKEIDVGKFSGAMGVYALDPKVEKLACEFLGLRPAKISTQILSRDFLAHYASTLAAIVNSIDRFATEIRHLAGTDIGEVAEFKKPGARGSSAMPGKSKLRNPIKSENVCGLAKVARGHLVTAFECEIVWGERTIDNSSPERIYLPDLTILTDFVLKRFTQTLEKLEVYPEQMMRNLWKTGGIVFAQRVMLKLVEKGMARDEAYALLEGLALKVEHGTFETQDGEMFTSLVYKNFEIYKLLTREELDKCFDPVESLKHIDTIFARFGLKKKNKPTLREAG
jgi:adenylosuccinate lyase